MVEKNDLKTLKDLRLGNLDDDYMAPVPGWAQDILKDAAKEWIKELEKEAATMYKEEGDSRDVHAIKAQIFWIKHFFNLED